MRSRRTYSSCKRSGLLSFWKNCGLTWREEGLHYPYVAHLSGPDPVRHLALLSKVEPEDVRKHTDLDFGSIWTAESE